MTLNECNAFEFLQTKMVYKWNGHKLWILDKFKVNGNGKYTPKSYVHTAVYEWKSKIKQIYEWTENQTNCDTIPKIVEIQFRYMCM